MADKIAVKEKLFKQIQENNLFKGKDPQELIDKDLINEGLIDSIAMMEMQAIIQEEFELEVPEEIMIIKLRTINDLINYIAENT